MHLNLHPSKEEIEQTEKWLIDEYSEENEGFYCNWATICKAISNKHFAIFKIEDETVGFVVWSNLDFYFEVDIMSIKPKFRNKGWGTKFFREFEQFALSKKCLVVKLFCSPRRSQFFWKSIGFLQFPDRGYSESDLTLYKPLIETSQPDLDKPLNRLELWDKEPHKAKKSSPRWVWDLDKVTNRKPIINPCDKDWNLKWILNDYTVYDGKTKYLERYLDKTIECDPFLFIPKKLESSKTLT